MVQNLINPTPLSEYSGGYFITYDEVTNSIANLPSDSFVGYMNPGPNYQAFDVYLNLPSGGIGKAYRNNRWPNDDHTSWVDEVDEEFNGTWGDGEGPFEFDIEFLFKDEADHLDDQGKYIHTD